MRSVIMIVRLEPYLESKIWGSHALSLRYKSNKSSEYIGEAWGISMIAQKESVIQDGDYQGMPFSILYEKESSLFGGLKGPFPLLVKVIDANDDLSVQVHPKHGLDQKHEAWVILNTKNNASIILGHHATSVNDFTEALRRKQLDDLLVKVSVDKNDTFYIKGGKLHGIGKGIELFEIQQASDVSYRVYDYDRKKNGQERKLHISKALEVMEFPDETIQRTIDSPFFNVAKVNCENEQVRESHQYGDYIYVKSGKGTIGEKDVCKYGFVFVSSKEKYKIMGELELLICTISSR